MNKKYAIYSPVILPLTTHVGAGIALDNHRYDLSYQVYQERADRIRIESYYFRTQFDFDNGTTLKFQYLEDAISGASPTMTCALVPLNPKELTPAHREIP